MPLHGQIAVESFRKLETDLTAITAGTQETDQNGEVAALIKIVTTQKGFTFDGGMLGIVKVVQQPAEIWVYVPRKLQKISIAHPDLGMLRDYYFQIPIEGGRSYEMRLSTGQTTTIVKKKLTETAELTIRITPPNAVLFLDGELQSLDAEGVFKKVVPVGPHDYRIEAVGFYSAVGSVEVKEGTNEPLVINMKSSMSILTVTCPDDEADILLNGEVKGKSRWTGNVPPGKYVVEARRAGHEPTAEEIEVGAREELTVSVAAPTPIYGKLRVETVPEGATVFVDGERCGVTPCDVEKLAHLLVGEHEVRIEKKDYNTYTTTVTLEKDELTLLSDIRLTQSAYYTILSKPKAKLTLDGREVGTTPYTDTLLVGEHHLRLEQKNYKTFDETVTLSASNTKPTFRLHWAGFPKSQFYVGAEACIGGSLAACGVVGAYLSGINAEFRFRYPFGAKETLYYNSVLNDGSYGISHPLDVRADYTLEGLVGYGIPLTNNLRLTPVVGIRSTNITGVTTDESAPDQKTYVLAGVGALKAEYGLSPHLSIVAMPEYAFPFNTNAFVQQIESACLSAAGWYGGLGLNVGIHINF